MRVRDFGGVSSLEIDAAQLKREAEEMTTLAGEIPSAVERANKGVPAKDLGELLKRIEKLSKSSAGDAPNNRTKLKTAGARRSVQQVAEKRFGACHLERGEGSKSFASGLRNQMRRFAA